jgi:hypothetical protein
MKAGIIIKTEFIAPGQYAYENFIDYEDDDEKTTWAPKEGSFADYFDRYMTSPAKTQGPGGSFTATRDRLDKEAKKQMKDLYRRAEKNGSMEWLTIFSFDEEFLYEQGLMTKDGPSADRIKECTRKAMMAMLEKEGLSDAVWTASFHRNLKIHNNYHVHVSTVEPAPSWTAGKGRCRQRSDGSLYQRGKIKESSMKAAKSSFYAAATAQNQDDMTSRIGEIRDRLYGIRKRTVKNERQSKEFIELINGLPRDMRLWKYGMTAMTSHRDKIDRLTTQFLEGSCRKEYDEYVELVMKKAEQYRRAYGKRGAEYTENKIGDLYQRLGNVLLFEMAEYEKERRKQERGAPASKNASASFQENAHTDIFRMIRSASIEIEQAAYSMKKLDMMFRRTIDNMKNEIAYERLRAKEDGLTR